MKFLERICEASREIPERLEHYTHGGTNAAYPGKEWRVIRSGDSFLEINFLSFSFVGWKSTSQVVQPGLRPHPNDDVCPKERPGFRRNAASAFRSFPSQTRRPDAIPEGDCCFR
jgi:hypothetical protein